MDYENDVKLWVDIRKAMGITQKEISERSGLSQQMVSDFESLKKKSFVLYFFYKNNFSYADSDMFKIGTKEEMPNAQND